MTTAAPPDTDRMLRARDHYQGLGFGLVPIPPGGKGPDLPGWQEGVPAPVLDRKLRDGQGLGAIHALSGTAVLDLDTTAELAGLALAAVGVDLEEILEAPGPKSTGNPAKPPKPWYRVPEGYELGRKVLRWPDPDDPSQRKVVLELRAGAGQDVLPPTTHPDTGEPYGWTEPPRTWEDLPLIPGPLLGLWLAWGQLRPAMEAACPWAEPPQRQEPRERKAPEIPRGEHTGPSIIDTWNERVPVSVPLERNGYEPAGGRRWIAPSSETRMPGVYLCDSGRVYSYHESDALAGPHAHDSFGVLTELEHAGDAREAARAAARELGLEPDRKQPEIHERAADVRAALTGGGG